VIDEEADDTLLYYVADVSTAQYYYAFGSVIPEMKYAHVEEGDTAVYKFGFNNQELENELGEYYTFEYRMYDSRIGKFLSVDPLSNNYPWNSTYAFAENRIIDGIDLEGTEYYYTADGKLHSHKTAYLSNNIPVSMSLANTIRIAYNITPLKWTIPGATTFNYKAFHSGTIEERNSILRTIYKKEIGGTMPNILAAIKDQGWGVTTGATAVDKSYMKFYTNAMLNGEYLLDNYYNLVNVMYHESLHFNGTGDDPFSHYEILKLQVLHSSYNNTTTNYKDYKRTTGLDYIHDMETSSSGFASFISGYDSKGNAIFATSNDKYNFEFYYLRYLENVKHFNATFNQNYQAKSKESYLHQ
jgi:RHS repeat-associated protein